MAKETLDDQEIVTLFQNEATQQKAFNVLVRKYQERMYWLIRKMVIDHEDANDITQDVFVKVWRSLSKFQGNSQLYTWIYKIATNECLTFLAKKKKRFFFSISDGNKELVQKLESSPYISGDELQIKLQKAILTLPDKQRLVFNMKYYDDLKYEEMSEILGTSVGALKASYHLASKKIEELFKKSEFSFE